MIGYKATYENKAPYLEEGMKIERVFYGKKNAERWLKSFGRGKYTNTKIVEVEI
jgi:hypothetical protein